MHIAFYAPLKSPGHPVPSGDRRVARLLIAALEYGGHTVDLASDLRAYDGAGDHVRQVELDLAGKREAERLVRQYNSGEGSHAPDLWFTYHLYYKAPDWIGPRVAAQMGIPYVTAEASHAEKRRNGPWSHNFSAVVEALEFADLHFCLTGTDMGALSKLLGSEQRLRKLPPFIDTVPRADTGERAVHRERLLSLSKFAAGPPIILTVAMMRRGDKALSYAMMADTLSGMLESDWNLVVVGDGAAKEEIVSGFSGIPADRIYWAGEITQDQLEFFYGGSDLYFWPACNEAYGMAFLEAQACGLPVVAQYTRGVPDVVENGKTGLLTPLGDVGAMQDALVRLLVEEDKREEFSVNAHSFVANERSLKRASQMLNGALLQLVPVLR